MAGSSKERRLPPIISFNPPPLTSEEKIARRTQMALVREATSSDLLYRIRKELGRGMFKTGDCLYGSRPCKSPPPNSPASLSRVDSVVTFADIVHENEKNDAEYEKVIRPEICTTTFHSNVEYNCIEGEYIINSGIIFPGPEPKRKVVTFEMDSDSELQTVEQINQGKITNSEQPTIIKKELVSILKPEPVVNKCHDPVSPVPEEKMVHYRLKPLKDFTRAERQEMFRESWRRTHELRKQKEALSDKNVPHTNSDEKSLSAFLAEKLRRETVGSDENGLEKTNKPYCFPTVRVNSDTFVDYVSHVHNPQRQLPLFDKNVKPQSPKSDEAEFKRHNDLQKVKIVPNTLGRTEEDLYHSPLLLPRYVDPIWQRRIRNQNLNEHKGQKSLLDHQKGNSKQLNRLMYYWVYHYLLNEGAKEGDGQQRPKSVPPILVEIPRQSETLRFSNQPSNRKIGPNETVEFFPILNLIENMFENSQTQTEVRPQSKKLKKRPNSCYTTAQENLNVRPNSSDKAAKENSNKRPNSSEATVLKNSDECPIFNEARKNSNQRLNSNSAKPPTLSDEMVKKDSERIKELVDQLIKNTFESTAPAVTTRKKKTKSIDLSLYADRLPPPTDYNFCPSPRLKPGAKLPHYLIPPEMVDSVRELEELKAKLYAEHRQRRRHRHSIKSNDYLKINMQSKEAIKAESASKGTVTEEIVPFPVRRTENYFNTEMDYKIATNTKKLLPSPPIIVKDNQLSCDDNMVTNEKNDPKPFHVILPEMVNNVREHEELRAYPQYCQSSKSNANWKRKINMRSKKAIEADNASKRTTAEAIVQFPVHRTEKNSVNETACKIATNTKKLLSSPTTILKDNQLSCADNIVKNDENDPKPLHVIPLEMVNCGPQHKELKAKLYAEVSQSLKSNANRKINKRLKEATESDNVSKSAGSEAMVPLSIQRAEKNFIDEIAYKNATNTKKTLPFLPNIVKNTLMSYADSTVNSDEKNPKPFHVIPPEMVDSVREKRELKARPYAGHCQPLKSNANRKMNMLLQKGIKTDNTSKGTAAEAKVQFSFHWYGKNFIDDTANKNATNTKKHLSFSPNIGKGNLMSYADTVVNNDGKNPKPLHVIPPVMVNRIREHEELRANLYAEHCQSLKAKRKINLRSKEAIEAEGTATEAMVPFPLHWDGKNSANGMAYKIATNTRKPELFPPSIVKDKLLSCTDTIVKNEYNNPKIEKLATEKSRKNEITNIKLTKNEALKKSRNRKIKQKIISVDRVELAKRILPSFFMIVEDLSVSENPGGGNSSNFYPGRGYYPNKELNSI